MSDSPLANRVRQIQKDIKQIKKDIGPPPEKKDDIAEGQPDMPASPPKGAPSKKPWYKTLSGWKLALEAIAIPFAIGYALVTFFQWQDLRHNFQADERAWVKPTPTADIYGVVANGAPVPWNADSIMVPFWSVTLLNIGKSVAEDIHGHGFLEVLDASKSPSFNFEQPHMTLSLQVLYPQEDYQFRIPLYHPSESPRPLTKDEYDRLMSGDFYLAVYTEITYRDQFGYHWVRMCRFGTRFDTSKFKTAYQGYNTKSCSDWNAVGDGSPPSRTF
jgi:hypothetical protein